jgi:hypothetical protein
MSVNKSNNYQYRERKEKNEAMDTQFLLSDQVP